MNELLNAWPLVLFLAIGIGIGRFIERRRWRAGQARADAAAKQLGDHAVRAGVDARNSIDAALKAGRDRVRTIGPLEVDGAMASAPPSVQERVKGIAGRFHYRDGVKNLDGSIGSVKLPGLRALHDALAAAAAEGAAYTLGHRDDIDAREVIDRAKGKR